MNDTETTVLKVLKHLNKMLNDLSSPIIHYLYGILEIPASRVFLGANAQLLGTSRVGTLHFLL